MIFVGGEKWQENIYQYEWVYDKRFCLWLGLEDELPFCPLLLRWFHLWLGLQGEVLCLSSSLPSPEKAPYEGRRNCPILENIRLRKL